MMDNVIKGCAFTSRGCGGGKRHRELGAEELQPLLLHGQSFNLLLQPPVLLLQLVEGLQHAHHWTEKKRKLKNK